jgi:hypothetical protein
MTPRRSLPRALFGALCVVVAILVLAGVRDDSWSVLSWFVPLGLVAAGAVALAGARRGSSSTPST